MSCANCDVPHALRQPYSPSPATLLPMMNALPIASPDTRLRTKSLPKPSPTIAEPATQYRTEIIRRSPLAAVDLAAMMRAPILGDVTAGEPRIPGQSSAPDFFTRRFESSDYYFVMIEDETFASEGVYPGDVLLVGTWMLDVWGDTDYIGKRVAMRESGCNHLHFGRYYPPDLVKDHETIGSLDKEIVGLVTVLCRGL